MIQKTYLLSIFALLITLSSISPIYTVHPQQNNNPEHEEEEEEEEDGEADLPKWSRKQCLRFLHEELVLSTTITNLSNHQLQNLTKSYIKIRNYRQEVLNCNADTTREQAAAIIKKFKNIKMPPYKYEKWLEPAVNTNSLAMVEQLLSLIPKKEEPPLLPTTIRINPGIENTINIELLHSLLTAGIDIKIQECGSCIDSKLYNNKNKIENFWIINHGSPAGIVITNRLLERKAGKSLCNFKKLSLRKKITALKQFLSVNGKKLIRIERFDKSPTAVKRKDILPPICAFMFALAWLFFY